MGDPQEFANGRRVEELAMDDIRIEIREEPSLRGPLTLKGSLRPATTQQRDSLTSTTTSINGVEEPLAEVADKVDRIYKSLKSVKEFSERVQIQWFASYAVHLMANTYSRFLRQQELAAAHAGCLIPAADLQQYPLVVSHFWLAREHPDPEGHHAKLIAQWLLQRAETQMAVFLDYCSLPQAPRTPTEQESFSEALGSMDLLFAHEKTWVLRVDLEPPASSGCVPYHVRGWCRFESFAASLKTDADKNMCLASAPRGSRSMVARLPEIFDEELHHFHFADRLSDKAIVSNLYLRLFERKVTAVRVYKVQYLDDDEARCLAEALPVFAHLRKLELEHCASSLGAAGAAALVQGLAEVSPWVDFTVYSITDEEAKRLSALLPSLLKLPDFELNLIDAKESLGEQGATCLAEALQPSLLSQMLRITWSSPDATQASEILRHAAMHHGIKWRGPAADSEPSVQSTPPGVRQTQGKDCGLM